MSAASFAKSNIESSLRHLSPPPFRPTFDIASLLPTFAIDTLVIRLEYGLPEAKASSVLAEKAETELNTGELPDDDVDNPPGSPYSNPSSLEGS